MKNLGLLILCISLHFVTGAQSPHVGDAIAPFGLKNVDGKTISINDYKQAKGFVIVFTCNHCPFAKLYTQRLNNLCHAYNSKGIVVLTVNSSDNRLLEGEAFDKMVAQAHDQHFEFPYLQDEQQTVARAFGATRTPQAFILFKENGKLILKYQGAIDDNGAEADKVEHHYVTDALNSLLAGKPVAVTDTKAVGCAIKLRNPL